jgi:3-(3-hydroxy-phenyl)propionate hydroxylase
MTRTSYAPVVIVGAGPTGVTAGIMLAQRGIGCLVLDRWPEVYPRPRAVHFDDEVFRIFAGLGITGQIRSISRPAPGMQLVDPQLRVLAEFRRDPAGQLHGYPQANMFDQPALERVLRSRLAELPPARFRGGVDVTGIAQVAGGPGRVRVRYRDRDAGRDCEVWTDAVLGCDGANSTTRTLIGATLKDLGFEQQWLVVDAESPEPLGVYDGVQQVCDHDRAATFMMVTPGRYRWEFRLRAGERPDDLGEAAVRELIRPWLGEVSPDKPTFVRRTWYTFRGAIADHWRDGRVFLLGDAAHLTPPFIGQGMCAGIRDAANLTWKLALVAGGRADDRLLDTYQAEREPHARRVIQMAMLTGWLMTGGTARTSRIRRAVLRTLSRLPGAEAKVLNAAWPGFPVGPLSPAGDRAAGRLCPQPLLHTDDGDVLLDQAAGDGFAIITRARNRIGVYDAETRQFFDALNTRVIDLAGTAGTADRSGLLASLLDDAEADALLLRPDRVVVASADRPDLRRWHRVLTAAGIGNQAVHS